MKREPREPSLPGRSLSVISAGMATISNQIRRIWVCWSPSKGRWVPLALPETLPTGDLSLGETGSKKVKTFPPGSSRSWQTKENPLL